MKKLKEKNIFLFLFVILIILIFICFKYINLKYKINDEININKNTKNYSLQIKYPVTPVSSINNKIKIMINNYRKDFLKTKRKKNIKYDLKINYKIEEYKNITTIHFTIYSFTGGFHYDRNDITYYYNNVSNKEINISSVFNKKYLNELSKISYNKIIDLKNKEKIDSDLSLINDGTKPIINNYKHLIFTEKGLKIIFPPNQVASYYNGEINILIPYNDINHILKSYYKVKKMKYQFKTNKYKRKFKNKKLIALTFDDGPNYGTTDVLLDELKKRNVKVTFFVLGVNASKYPDLVSREVKEGHQVGSHTYSHKQLNRISIEEASNEINSNNELIKNITGKYPTLIRPPYGSINSEVRNISNMSIILWNVDTNDWRYRDKEYVSNHIINSVSDGDIILLHDIYTTSVEGVLIAIDELRKQGYEFVTINEMANIKGVPLENNNYYSF